jgi:hypothetical protein
MKIQIRAVLATLVLLSTLSLQPSTGFAQGTAFTYQGRLNVSTNPANGSYDLRFTLFPVNSGGAPAAGPLTNSATGVSNGLFLVTLDFGGVFTGTNYWLEIGVRTNGGGTFTNLVPRQKITPTPYAIYAAGASAAGISGTIPAANLTGTYGSAVTFNNPANSFSGNGTGLTNVNAATLGGFGAASFWNLGGNAGTTPGTQFLGTTDNLPMEFKVNGTRALRLEPNPNAPNVIGGSAANEVTNGLYGAVIVGGGSSFYPNRVGAIFGTVVGGNGNTASGNFATAMGQFNTASGYAGTAMGYSTVAGGFGSQAGGTTAKANHDGTFVWADNTFVDFASTAVNQFLIRAANGVGINTNNPNGAALAVNGNVTVNNTIGTPGNQPLELKANNQRGLRLEPTSFTDTVNVIGGSARNFVGVGVVGATIGGGGSGNYFGFAYTNRVEADFGTVSGGYQNTIQSLAYSSTIGGGRFNTIRSSGIGSTIGGGDQNTNDASAATIGGGLLNTIEPNAQFATIGGGDQNTIQTYANNATIGGGYLNTIWPNIESSTIGGGQFNSIQTYGYYATIGGGYNNTIQPNAYFATIPGGQQNSATNYAFAAGNRAKANHTGAFVWADSTDADFASTANNQFAIRASGGVVLSDSTPNLSFGSTTRQMLNLWGTKYGIGVQTSTVYFRTDNASGLENGFAWYKGGIHTNAAQNAGGGTTMMTLNGSGLTVNGTFVSASDRNVKQDFAEVNSRTVLEKVAQLPIQTWAYKNDPNTKHLGPVAQDFYAAFNVGPDDKHIATVDESGVALAAIQGLNQKVEEKEARITALENELSEIKHLLTKLADKKD